jgi:glycosyltransferase involved in cell wall biosynthesis
VRLRIAEWSTRGIATFGEVDVSVVVCAHNEERHLGEQLEALLAQQTELQWELLVVDNRSTDRTSTIVEHCAECDPRVRLVRADERASKTHAMNVGVEAARADRLAFCDADDVVAPGWLEAIGRALSEHQVVTGPHELDRLNPKWLADSRGRSIERQSVGSFAGVFPTIRGASWGTRRSVWDALGGMTGPFPGEDLEFSFRCWMAGIDIVGVDDAVIHYRYRESTRALWRQGLAYGAGRPKIARLVNDSGRARVPPFAGWRSWAILLASLPRLLTHHGRAAWVWVAANRIGQVVGSVRARTVML